MLKHRTVYCSETDKTSEDTIPVMFWLVAGNENLNTGRRNRGKSKPRDSQRQNKQNLKIQRLYVGDSRKTQKELSGRGLMG